MMRQKVTLFAVPKRFDHSPHIAMIQNNAIATWTRLRPEVEILLMCDDPGVREAAERFGCIHIPDVRVNEWGTPLVDSVFERAQEIAGDGIMCYVNADILLFQSFIDAVHIVAKEMDRFMMVGRRFDWDKPVPIKFSQAWEYTVQTTVQKEGRWHNAYAMDYFVFPCGFFQKGTIPPFTLGWYSWDNFLVIHAVERDEPLVDASSFVFIAHQAHPEKLNQKQRAVVGDNPQRTRNLALAGGLEYLRQNGGGHVGRVNWVLTKDGELRERAHK